MPRGLTALPLLACAAAFASVTHAQPLQALQTFPNKPIRMVVGFAPGGGADGAARLTAAKLSELWGQQVVVDNRAGAGGNTAAEIVARSAPDGYVLLFTSPGPIAISPALSQKLPYDPKRDFTPITLVASGPNVLVVPPTLKAANVKELIALAANGSARLSYGSSGIGSTPFLSAELFKMMARVDMLHVPYKGAGPAVIDLLGGRLDVMLVSGITVVSFIRAQRLKALAVTTLQRSALLPDLPTLHEAGVPGYEANVWWGLLAPAGLSGDLLKRINQAAVKSLRSPDIVSRFAADGVEAAGSSPAELAAYMASETAKWRRVIAAAGIKPE